MESRVYNPHGEQPVNEATYIGQLPPEVRDWVKAELARKIAEEHGGEGAEGLLERAMAGRICDLEGLVAPSEVLDKWAVHQSFDPDMVVARCAYWLLFDNAGRQAVFEASLMEDDFSPNGLSWDTGMYTFRAQGSRDGLNVWEREHEGAFWGYGNAFELEREMPTPPAPDGVEWNTVRIEPLFAVEALGIKGGAAARRATRSEIARAVEAEWSAGGPNDDLLAASADRNDRIEAARRGRFARALAEDEDAGVRSAAMESLRASVTFPHPASLQKVECAGDAGTDVFAYTGGGGGERGTASAPLSVFIR